MEAPPRRRQRSTQDVIRAFVEFTLTSPYADEIARSRYPHLTAIELYRRETGIDINPRTAKRQAGKWAMINGRVFKI